MGIGDFHSHGSGDPTRPLWFRDSSLGDKGESEELGYFRSLVVGIVEEFDPQSGAGKYTQAFLQPRNWHLAEADEAIDPDFDNAKDRRLSVSLISDHEHDFPYKGDSTDAKSPYRNDWQFSQKSTRIVDYHDPGHTALLAQLVKVTDDHMGQYTTSIPFSREVGGHEPAAAGYIWDDSLEQNGLLDTVFILNTADKYGLGRDGTPYGIAGLRTDAHFEWTTVSPPTAGGDHHGSIMFDTTDVSKYGTPSVGSPVKMSLAWDPSVAGQNSGIGEEKGKWRPWCRIPFVTTQNPPWDGPVSTPGDGTTPGPTDGGIIVVPVTDGGGTPPDPGHYVSIGGKDNPNTGGRELIISDGGGRWVTVGPSRGPLSTRPLTPSYVGDSWFATDKINAPGGSGNADPTETYAVAVNDALQWAHVALLDFDQTHSATLKTSGTITYTGAGHVNANQLATYAVATSVPSTGKALVWGGASYSTATLGFAGGGTGTTSYVSGSVLIAGASAFTGVSPSNTDGGQILQDTGSGVVDFAYGANRGTADGVTNNVSGSTRFLDFTGFVSSGTGTGGAMRFYVTPPGTTGATLNTKKIALFIDGKANVAVNEATLLAQNATDGFFYLPACSTGAPSGTPSTFTGAVPMVWGGDGNLYGNPTGLAWVQVNGASSSHALLDGTVDNDTTAGTVVRGDVITGQGATPKWTRLALGSSGTYFRSNGTDASWSALALADATGTLGPTHGGTGLAAYTLGDTLYASAANTLAALAGNTTTTKKFLTQTGTGAASAAPAWGTIAAADVPDLSATYVPTTRTISTSSPLTGGGDLSANRTISFSNQSANTVLAGPTTGAATAPTFRALVAADIPSLDASIIATGTLAVARGGTGLASYTAGDLLYASAGTTIAKLGIGSTDQILQVRAGVPTWQTPLSLTAASGANVAGTTFTASAGQGTGTGLGGDFVIQTAPAGTTGSSVNALVPTLTLKGAGNLAVFGNGVTAATPTAYTIQATSASGTNVAGANFTLAGSQGTGTGVGGSLLFQVAPAGTTGSSLNALATALTIDSTKAAAFAGTILAASGTSTAPSIAFSAETTNGIFRPSAGILATSNGTTLELRADDTYGVQLVPVGGTSRIAFKNYAGTEAQIYAGRVAAAYLGTDKAYLQGDTGPFGVSLTSDCAVSFSSTTNNPEATRDTHLIRYAANVLGASTDGANVSGSLAAALLYAGDASGANIAGTDLVVGAGKSTGTGAGGSLLFKVTPPGGTGSTLNAFATALTIDSTKLATFAGNASLQTVVAGTWNGTAIGAAYGGTGQTSYTTGDLLYASGASAISKLAAVATGSVLASQGTSTAPAWGTISSVLDTIGSTRGAVLYRGATGWAILAPGTSGYVLTSNGAGADPSYQAGGGVGSTSFADNVFDVHDDLDATKKLVLQCSGITTATTRTWTVPDVSGTVALIDGGQTFTSATWHATAVGAQYGGTGLDGSAAANGTLLIGNGSGYALAALTAGSGISITNGAGSISIAATGSAGLTTKYMQGLQWHTTGTLTIKVSAGKCRNAADTGDLTLAADTTVTLDSTGSPGIANNGIDVLTGSGTVSITSGTASVSGSGTAFLTEFKVKNLTGTVEAIGTTLFSGTGTKFLTEVAIGDLVGTNSAGYARVTAINSDTNITMSAALTIAFGTTGVLIEQPVFRVVDGVSSEGFHVNTITSNTALTVTRNATNTHTAKTYTIGGECSQTWYFVWLGSDGTNTKLVLSSQYSALLSPGAYTSFRKLGAVRYSQMASGFRLWRMYTVGDGNTRDTLCDEDANDATANGGFGYTLSAGTSTTYIDVACSSWAPRSAVSLNTVLTFFSSTNTGNFAEVRRRLSDYSSPPTTDVNNLVYAWATNLTLKNAYPFVVCDPAQYIQYKLSANAGNASTFYITVQGYKEVL